jgi:hypothetical protein
MNNYDAPELVRITLKADRPDITTDRWFDVKMEAEVLLDTDGGEAHWAYVELGTVGQIIGRSAKFELNVANLDAGKISRRKPDGGLVWATKFGPENRKVETLEEALRLKMGLWVERQWLTAEGREALVQVSEWKPRKEVTVLKDGTPMPGKWARFGVKNGAVLRLETRGWKPTEGAILETEEL